MDKSETYIKMCEKSTEIQKERCVDWKRCNGDLYYHRTIPYRDRVQNSSFKNFKKLQSDWQKYEKNLLVYCHQSTECSVKHDFKDYSLELIWLPYQDQLQDILLQEWNFHDLVYHYASEYSDDGWKTPEWANDGKWELKYNTMEQLWLAYLMHKKYNKIWNGSDWIKEDK